MKKVKAILIDDTLADFVADVDSDDMVELAEEIFPATRDTLQQAGDTLTTEECATILAEVDSAVIMLFFICSELAVRFRNLEARLAALEGVNTKKGH